VWSCGRLWRGVTFVFCGGRVSDLTLHLHCVVLPHDTTLRFLIPRVLEQTKGLFVFVQKTFFAAATLWIDCIVVKSTMTRKKFLASNIGKNSLVELDFLIDRHDMVVCMFRGRGKIVRLETMTHDVDSCHSQYLCNTPIHPLPKSDDHDGTCRYLFYV